MKAAIDTDCLDEIRNPLSALIGCADEIISSLNEFRSASLAWLDEASTEQRSNHLGLEKPPLHLIGN